LEKNRREVDDEIFANQLPTRACAHPQVLKALAFFSTEMDELIDS
jgi:hypothetical protein